MTPLQEIRLFYAALYDNNMNMVEKYLKEGYSINKKDESGRTPMHFVIKNIRNSEKRYEICKMLLNYGADINSRDSYGDTPLHYLLDKYIGGKVKDDGTLLNLLITKGAEINSQSRVSTSLTPLSYAVSANNLKAAKKLLKLGAVLSNSKDLLSSAIFYNNTEMLRILIRYGANVNDFRVINILFTVLYRPDCLELFIDYGDVVNAKNFSNQPPYPISEAMCSWLYKTIMMQNSDMFELLLENGVDINSYKLGSNNEKCCILSHVYSKYHEYESFVRSSEYGSMLRKTLKHIAILIELKGTKIKEETLNFIEKNEFLRKEFEKYVKQVKVMRVTRVREDLNITYFDFFSRRGKSLWNSCTDDIVSAISEDEVKVLFPDFEKKLKRIIQKGVRQGNATRDFQQILYNILEPKLSFDVICYISDFMNMRDLAVFRLRDLEL